MSVSYPIYVYSVSGCIFDLAAVLITSVREVATICPRPCKLTYDLLTLKVVYESILVFLCISVLDLGPMNATDRRQTASSLNAPA